MPLLKRLLALRLQNRTFLRAAAVLLLAGATTGPASAMTVALPLPDGPYAVGMQRFELVDASRRGVGGGDPTAARVLPVYVWYPARTNGTPSTRPYFNAHEQATQARSMARNFNYGETELDGLHAVLAHSTEGAPPVHKPHGFPLIVFNHGYECYPSQNTVLMERWASHGHVVVSIAHPHDAVDLRLDDGRVLTTSKAPTSDPSVTPLRRTVRSARTAPAERLAALNAYRAASASTRLGLSQAAWRDDNLFVVAAMNRGDVPAALKAILRQADPSRLAMTGMSFGGAAAVDACRLLANCKAAINLDGGNQDPASFNVDVGRPLLLMQSDWTDVPGAAPGASPPGRLGPEGATSVAQGEHPSAQHEGSPVSPNDFDYETWRDAGTHPDVVRLRLDGIKHMGYTDLILLMDGPKRTERFGRIAPAAAVDAIGSATLAFLQQYLHGGSRRALVSVLERTPALHWHDPAGVRERSGPQR
jgi:dienelactone hydrolase